MAVQLRNKVITAQIQNPELVLRVKRRINECFDQLRALTGKMLFPEDFEPVVFFNQSTKAGYVWPRKYGYRVFLNWVLLRENEKEFFDDTIPHEVAHLFQRAIDPNSPSHGRLWQALMRRMGVEPERCHKMDTKRAGRDKKRHIYVCACKKHEMTTTKHNKILRGYVYRCTKCKKTLVSMNRVVVS